MSEPKDTFSAGEAALIAGVPYGSLDYWARTGLIVPSVVNAKGSGSERRYNFRDLVALRVAGELRRAGISTRALQETVKEIRGVRNPLAESRLLAIGSTVVWVKANDEAIDVLKRPGQGVFASMLDFPRTAREVHAEAKALRAAA